MSFPGIVQAIAMAGVARRGLHPGRALLLARPVVADPAGAFGRRGAGAFIARITRSSMLDVLGEDFIRTARAKGCPAMSPSSAMP